MGSNDKVEATFHPNENQHQTERNRLGEVGSSSFRTLDKIVRDNGISDVIGKLTAPPETVRQHLDRIGVEYREGKNIIVILVKDLNAAENPKEGQDE